MPSRKFIFGAITICSIIALYFLITTSIKKTDSLIEKNRRGGILVINPKEEKLNNLITKDSDGDGVPDWEEKIWQTNPYRKDTYNVGGDALYIQQKKETIARKNPNATTATSSNQTEQFSREFLTTILAINASGADKDSVMKAATEQIAARFAQEGATSVFSENDLSLVNNPTQKDRLNYKNAMELIAQKYKNDQLGYELEYISQIVGKNNTTVVPKLEKISTAYANMAHELSQIPIPSDIKQTHLDLINGFANTSLSITKMKQAQDDSVLALLGISQYSKAYAQMENAFTALADYYKNNDMING